MIILYPSEAQCVRKLVSFGSNIGKLGLFGCGEIMGKRENFEVGHMAFLIILGFLVFKTNYICVRGSLVIFPKYE